jgi:hypothetical protein
MANYQTPKPVNKSEVKADFAKYELKYANQTKTLSQFVEKQVVNLWDCESMTDAELLVLKEQISKKSMVSLVIIELKN